MNRFLNRLLALFLGIIFVPLKKIYKQKKNVWVFGSDLGEKYSQNSKYLFEYVLKHDKNIKVYWITQSKEVYRYLRKRGLPVIYNFSIRGIIYSLTAEKKMVSTWFSDIYYTFPSNIQKVVYLHHGMPLKKIFYDDPKRNVHPNVFYYPLKSFFYSHFLCNYPLELSSFTPVTSNYFKTLMEKAMHNNNIYVYGQPRTDSFLHLDRNKLLLKYGLNDNDFIILYMPTHRRYGRGEPSPHIFIDNIQAIEYFKNNNIKIIWKQHPNMLNKYQKMEAPSCFVEQSFNKLSDSQELLFLANILITDFSSCYIDYMLLKRPILFYHYDNYEEEDNELYFTSKDLLNIGNISKNEKELFDDIKCVMLNHKTFDYAEKFKMFNECLDDKACERCYNKLLTL